MVLSRLQYAADIIGKVNIQTGVGLLTQKISQSHVEYLCLAF